MEALQAKMIDSETFYVRLGPSVLTGRANDDNDDLDDARSLIKIVGMVLSFFVPPRILLST